MDHLVSNWEARGSASHQLQALLDPEYFGRTGTDGIVKSHALANKPQVWDLMKDNLSTGNIFDYSTKSVAWATHLRKDWSEGSAAKARQRLDNSIGKHVDPIAKKASDFLDTGKELNETCAKSVKRMVIAYEQKAHTLNHSAESMARNVQKVSGSVAKASEAVSSSTGVVEETARTMSESIHNLSQNIDGVFVRLNSSLGAITGLLSQAVAQMHVLNQTLRGIKDELSAQNTLISSGGSGPDGFAKVVYDFAQLHMKKPGEDNHRFFLWHPDNSWHGAFESILKDKPLDASFCAYSDDLDRLCVCMKTARQAQSQSPNLVFHLLIPAWYPITITEPLHFPDELQPLRVEGSRHGGGIPQVSFNLPAAQKGLLDGIANILDPLSKNSIATGAAIATGIVAVPIWWATNKVYNLLCEEAPRILGSNERLKVPKPF